MLIRTVDKLSRGHIFNCQLLPCLIDDEASTLFA